MAQVGVNDMLGAYLEQASCNNQFFLDATVDDIVLMADSFTQNILIGQGAIQSDGPSAMNISSTNIQVNRPLILGSTTGYWDGSNYQIDSTNNTLNFTALANRYTPSFQVTSNGINVLGDVNQYGSRYISCLWSNVRNSNQVFILQSNIGINTSTPQYALDVVGNINISGGLLLSNNQPYVLPVRYYDSNWGVYNNLIYTYSNVGFFNSNPQYTIDVHGDINFTGTLYSNNIRFVSSPWSFCNSTIYTITCNVGIGTSNPIANLDVRGDISLTGDMILQNKVYLSGIELQKDLYDGEFMNITNVLGNPQTLSNVAKFYTYSNVVYSTGYNVGINTTQPQATLDVNGSLNINGDLTIENRNILFSGLQLQKENSAGVYNVTTYIGPNSNHYISTQFTTAGSNVFILQSNIGIGTNNPRYALDVPSNAIYALGYCNLLQDDLSTGLGVTWYAPTMNSVYNLYIQNSNCYNSYLYIYSTTFWNSNNMACNNQAVYNMQGSATYSSNCVTFMSNMFYPVYAGILYSSNMYQNLYNNYEYTYWNAYYASNNIPAALYASNNMPAAYFGSNLAVIASNVAYDASNNVSILSNNVFISQASNNKAIYNILYYTSNYQSNQDSNIGVLYSNLAYASNYQSNQDSNIHVLFSNLNYASNYQSNINIIYTNLAYTSNYESNIPIIYSNLAYTSNYQSNQDQYSQYLNNKLLYTSNYQSNQDSNITYLFDVYVFTSNFLYSTSFSNAIIYTSNHQSNQDSNINYLLTTAVYTSNYQSNLYTTGNWASNNLLNTYTGGTITANLTITGDLTVSGTTTYIDTQNLMVESNIITLNNGDITNPYLVPSGLVINRGSSSNYSIVYDELTSVLRSGFSSNLYAIPNSYGMQDGYPFYRSNLNMLITRQIQSQDIAFSSNFALYNCGIPAWICCSNQNIGIGTQVPTTPFDVRGYATFETAIMMSNGLNVIPYYNLSNQTMKIFNNSKNYLAIGTVDTPSNTMSPFTAIGDSLIQSSCNLVLSSIYSSISYNYFTSTNGTPPGYNTLLYANSLALTNGASVSSWGCFSQSTLANQPKYYSIGGDANNYPYVSFSPNGTANFMPLSSPLTLNSGTNSGFTAFFYLNFTAYAANMTRLLSLSDNTNSFLEINQLGNALFFCANGFTLADMYTDIININVWQAITFRLSGNTLSVYSDMNLLNSTTVPYLTNKTFTNGGLGIPYNAVAQYDNSNLAANISYAALYDSYINDTTLSNMIQQIKYPATYNNYYNNLTITNSNAFTFSNFGIGRSNPVTMLDVASNATFRGYISMSNQYGSNTFYTSNYNIGLNTSNPFAEYHIYSPMTSNAQNNGVLPLLALQTSFGAQTSPAIDFYTFTTETPYPASRIYALDDVNYSSHMIFQTKYPGANQNSLLERFRIASGGFIGINNSNPNYRISVYGPNADMTGPHMAFYTSGDNNPLYQLLPWSHNNISMNFDCYYNNGANYSSTSTGQFQINKSANILNLNYANISGGSVINTFNPGISLLSSGNVGISNNNPLTAFDVNGVTTMRNNTGFITLSNNGNTLDLIGSFYNTNNMTVSNNFYSGTVTCSNITITTGDVGATDPALTGSLVFQHIASSGGYNAISFQSTANAGSDTAAVYYFDNLPQYGAIFGASAENSALCLFAGNDANANGDNVVVAPTGAIFLDGLGANGVLKPTMGSPGNSANVCILGKVTTGSIVWNGGTNYSGGTSVYTVRNTLDDGSGNVTLKGTLNSGNVTCGTINSGNVTCGTINASTITGTSEIYSGNGCWFRSTGACGWYNNTYAGGWYMNDTSAVRVYNDKNIATGGNVYASTFYGYLSGNISGQSTSCSGNAASSSYCSGNCAGSSSSCTGNAASASYCSGDCGGTANNANNAYQCSGTASVANTARHCTGDCDGTANNANNLSSTNYITAYGLNSVGNGISAYYGSYASCPLGVNAAFIDTTTFGNNLASLFNRIYGNENLYITGSITKGSGTFDIQHPLYPENIEKRLVHSFIEGPRCDLIYRGLITLSNGTATVNIDSECVSSPECAMEQGTFVELCTNPQYFLQNTNTFDRVLGSINNNILSINCENINSSAIISWMIIAERKDDHIKKWERTNKDGYLVTEYLNSNINRNTNSNI